MLPLWCLVLFKSHLAHLIFIQVMECGSDQQTNLDLCRLNYYFYYFFLLCCKSSKNSVRDRPIDCDTGGFGDISKKKREKMKIENQ